ncbi:S-formylglutathione hydrolase [Vineibacter terrae]|uniref:S-formylglutathione hydrolase n=1 Tax=Vineibacter terrae TaxID=2586908 RepID=A0A5C8PP01_9HYPH|nr:S-formylglutathione hydrolase [Vineibacter terrae]TXL76285.1 S-formylglutathione hydrolase [Vineibacter terrae]
MTAPTLRSRHRCYAGEVRFYGHKSTEVGGEMRFAVFVPPQAAQRPVPVLFYLAGLTCTEETFMIKAAAFEAAVEAGLMLVAPDTSPRDRRYPGDDESWDFGLGAGFYLDATATPWRDGYRMHAYVTQELPALVTQHLPARRDRLGIFGHSMGGHGALVAALRHAGLYRSVSAFAPIAAPSRCPWGEKAFSRYLGSDRGAWAAWDATALVEAGGRCPPILIDQGMDDQFLEQQLHPHLFEAACRKTGQPLVLRRHDGYDHGYYFISTFMADHIGHHAAALNAA